MLCFTSNVCPVSFLRSLSLSGFRLTLSTAGPVPAAATGGKTETTPVRTAFAPVAAAAAAVAVAVAVGKAAAPASLAASSVGAVATTPVS